MLKSTMKVFDYTDYRSFMFDALGGRKRTGDKMKLAKHLNCQPAHLSQVLKEKNNLSLEHALKATSFFGLSSHEADYFINLVQIGSAGSKELELHFIKKNETLLNEAVDIRKNLKSNSTELTPKQQAIYYSNRLYALVHVAVSLPSINTIKDLSDLLKVNLTELNSIVQFLMNTQIIKTDARGVLKTGPGHTFLSKTSPFLKTHHQNVRRHSSLKIEQDLTSNDIHYSAYYTLSKKDFEKIKVSFLEIIAENLKIVEPSDEEVICCNTIDFFEVK